ncbi:MAG TPA: hypothetical protein DFS52_01650, partial [Myxococcales bacterium]|nr:hypothetical protein [Myxococcales bacterium]
MEVAGGQISFERQEHERAQARQRIVEPEELIGCHDYLSCVLGQPELSQAATCDRLLAEPRGARGARA